MNLPHTYLGLQQGHGWDIPDRLNMAVEVCDDWADSEPDRLAIVEYRVGEAPERLSFGALRRMADSLAHELARSGVARGDRVGVLRSQSGWTAAAHIAIWKLGAVSIPLFTLFGDQALTDRLDDSGAVCVIADPVSRARVAPLQANLPNLVRVLVPEVADLDTNGPAYSTADTQSEDPAVLIYTSGTTGGPKGALHAHRVLRGHLPGVEISHDFLPQQGDVIWTPADWAWIGGLFDVLMPGLWHGVPVVAARMAKFSPNSCIDIIRQCSVRNAFFPPTALRALKAADLSIPGLRSVASGGEPLGAEMLDWGRKAFGVSINEFYGQTECNMIVSSCGVAYPPVPGAMGKAVPGHVVEVVDESGAPTLEEGDIAVLIGSASMMLGYWNNPQATAEKYRGDWMITGDRGWREGEFLRFHGRDDDVITSSGYRIGPGEVEDCLLTHPAVASAGVVGTPDAQRTEAVTAFVVLKPGHTGDDALCSALQDHVRQRLAAHEYPRKVHFVESLPMTISGKIIRRELRRVAGEERAR